MKLQQSGHGVRGIGNIVEGLLINPLSRFLFDSNVFVNAMLAIDKISDTEMPYYLEYTAESI